MKKWLWCTFVSAQFRTSFKLTIDVTRYNAPQTYYAITMVVLFVCLELEIRFIDNKSVGMLNY